MVANRRPFSFAVYCALIGFVGVAACGDSDSAEPPRDAVGAAETAETYDGSDVAAPGDTAPAEPPGLLRFIHVSDLHYSGTLENPRRDYIAARVNRVNAVDFEADRVVITGDIIDYLPSVTEGETIAEILVEELDNLFATWLPAIGNHEFYEEFDGTAVEITDDKEAREAAFSAAMGYPLWFADVVNGVRLIILHSVDGSTWNQNAGLLGSFGAEQLAWLDNQLADGRPSILFFHHPPNTLVTEPGAPALCDVIEDHPGVVKAMFTGHLHGFWEKEECGVPYWIVGNWRDDDQSYFLVEYDGAEDRLTIVNRDELPFPEMPDFTCEPDQDSLLDPTAAVDTIQQLLMTDMIADAEGIAQYLGDGISELPMVIRADDWDADSEEILARLSIASRWGESGSFLEYLDGAPCLPFDFALDEDCFTAGPLSMNVDLLELLGAAIDITLGPEWRARMEVNNFNIEGRLVTDGDQTVIEDGIVFTSVYLGAALRDVKNIIVREYCEGNIEGCAPGDGDNPECPAEWAASGFEPDEFFALIPRRCDVVLEMFSLRMVIQMVSSVPETIQLIGAVSSTVLTEDRIDPVVFERGDGLNCR